MSFQSPNYTQTPNDFFEMMKDMESSELRVTLVMIRQTFGFHRNGFKMGINKLAALSGQSRNAAKDGALAAEKRGTFRRTNPESQAEAEWELIIDGQSMTILDQSVTTPQSINDSQVGIKERIKKNKPDQIDGMLHFGKLAQSQGEDKIEEVITALERGLRVNIGRTLANQQVAKRIIKDGRPLETWLTWVKSDEWRLARLYIYADMEKVWRDYPQAFGGDEGMNPQGLEVGV